MGNQSRQSAEDTRQQAMGGEQPQDLSKKELKGKRKVAHGSGDRNANESMREEGYEHPRKTGKD
jgi:hypothetical protein